MVDPTPAFEWLSARWRDYYRHADVAPPDRVSRREFGFIFFGQKFFLRHTGFRRRADLERFLRSRAPAHAYYSTAYYQDPGAPRMVEKGWLGAELIFDLDADHVPGSQNMPYAAQLAEVKRHFIRLVDEFLVGDFGFSEKAVLLTFSGGRGYHAHVVSEDALQLSAPERREIVDYITANRLDVDAFLRRQTIGTTGQGPYRKAVRNLTIDPTHAPGWGGRLNRFLVEHLEGLRLLTDEEVTARLLEIPGIGPKKAPQLAREVRRVDLERVRDEGYLSQGEMLVRFVPTVLEKNVLPLAKGETDEPVTSDTKRLIRLPGSLHGKTGLKVVTLTRDELDAFDPLVEAVAFGEEPVAVRVVRPLSFTLGGAAYDLKPEEKVRLPEAAAAFAMARGCALPAGT
jgi:DNA primase small subunit